MAHFIDWQVSHLIKVAAESQGGVMTSFPRDQPPDVHMGDGVGVSAVLPASSALLCVVLSRWDDVVGPQTLHVWVPRDNSAPQLGRRVRYVTGHAVSCTSVSAAHGAASLSVVPDLHVAFVSRLFHAADAPFALAAVVELERLYFLHGRHTLLQHWLQRLAFKISPQLRQV